MNFEDAVKLQAKGKSVYREDKPKYIWAKDDFILRWTPINPKRINILSLSFNLMDLKATDWAIFEEKKVFNLSDMVVTTIPETNPNNSNILTLAYKPEDIQQFITEIKAISDHKELHRRIDLLAGARFK